MLIEYKMAIQRGTKPVLDFNFRQVAEVCKIIQKQNTNGENNKRKRCLKIIALKMEF